jgi:3'-5' exoribonuclease 1
MRYSPLPPPAPPDSRHRRALAPYLQPYDAFLVLDVEATCLQGTDFNYPNEIIVCPSTH